MDRNEKKSHTNQIKGVLSLLDYFNQRLGIDTFDAKVEIAKIQSIINNLYLEKNTKITKHENENKEKQEG
jgi:hypothetical protein